MAKPLFQDIVPPEKRSIKKIPLPQRAPAHYDSEPHQEVRTRPSVSRVRPVTTSARSPRITRIVEEPELEEEEIEHEYHETEQISANNKKSSFKKIYLIPLVIILIAIGGYLAIPKMSGARVVLTPQQQPISIDAQFTAQTTPTDNGLQFQTVTISKEGKLPITATGEETVQLKASGTIIIYNSFSSSPQKLVANTRFQTPNGLIFRITQPITIPGAKIDNGQTIPGSIEATVTADAAGAQYNSGLTDFSIPGFKGDPKFTKIYGRSKTPIQGGFSGTRKKVDDAQAKDAQSKIRAELKNSLIKQAQKDIPEASVLPNNAFFIEYESLPSTQLSETEVQLNERATFHGFIFNRAALAQQISKKAQGTVPEPGDVLGVENLNFILKDSINATTSKVTSLAFSLQGTSTLVASVDTAKLQKDLVGKPRKSLNAILTAYPGVAKAEVIMRPFWKTTFPEKPEDITIQLTPKP